MKNLKTIIGTLVLTVFLFGCQTNDEIIEFQTENQTTKARGGLGLGDSDDSQGDENTNIETITISVDYHHGFYTELMREYYSGFFDFRGYTSCGNESYIEIWQIGSMSQEEFNTLIMSIETIIIQTTLNGDGNDDDDPIGNIVFRPLFSYNGTCN